MINWIKKIISPELKLTNEEKKTQSILIKLLSKTDTDLIEQPYSTSILVANSQLDCYIEINGNISIVNDNIFRVIPYRLTFIEQLKSLAHKEIANRYAVNKEKLFNKSLSLLDDMETKLS